MTLDEPGSPTFGFGAIVAQAREEAGVSQQEFARSLGQAGRKCLLAEFGWDRLVEQLLMAYTST